MQEAHARPRSQPQRVVDGVSERIRNGSLKPGERVASEPELMREFGVSRTVVREAMSRLQAGGLVETHQGVGTFVLAPPVAAPPLLSIDARNVQVHQVLSMLELRISVESEAASLAAMRRSDVHLAAMREALDAFESQRQAGGSMVEEDFRFHGQIAAATGNEFFEEVLRTLGRATLASRDRFAEAMPALRRFKEVAQREHEAIYDAIVRGDPGGARAAMFMHLNNSRERLRSTLASSG